MKTIYTSTFLLLLGGLAFFGYAYYWQSSDNTVNPGKVVESIPDTSTTQNPNSESGADAVDPEELKRIELENATNLMNSAIIDADPDQCELIQIAEMKKECIEKSSLALAQKENDPTKCDVLSVSGARECKDQIYFRLAQISGKISDCTEISNSGILDKCTQTLELTLLKDQLKNKKQNNGKIDCDTFTNELAKDQCKADLQVANDQSQLEKAIEIESTENCDNISAPNLKQECKDTVYFSRAKTNRSIDICDNIVNGDARDFCKTTIEDYSDSDIFTEAIEKQSLDLCNKILAADMKRSCIDRVSISEIIKSGSRDDCATISDVSLRNSCESSF